MFLSSSDITGVTGDDITERQSSSVRDNDNGLNFVNLKMRPHTEPLPLISMGQDVAVLYKMKKSP